MRNSPEGMRATKRLLRAQQKGWLDTALELAMEANAEGRQTADFREGVGAFLEKRKPVWNREQG
jgi:methylglutaconyl-CoA hydratase